uniref:Ribose-5-phosphate isomerase n=1 Tax=Schistocephalus solidus TaxID=70667 RepID=A0A0X3PED8_SCHSO
MMKFRHKKFGFAYSLVSTSIVRTPGAQCKLCGLSALKFSNMVSSFVCSLQKCWERVVNLGKNANHRKYESLFAGRKYAYRPPHESRFLDVGADRDVLRRTPWWAEHMMCDFCVRRFIFPKIVDSTSNVRRLRVKIVTVKYSNELLTIKGS